MEGFSLFSFIILVIATLGQTTAAAEPPIEVTLCPQNTTIAPCICGDYWYGFEVECAGSEVNQTSIENAFKEVRAANGIPEDRVAFIYRFLIRQTNLTQLDLAPFYGNAMYYVNFEENANLTKLVTSGKSEDHGSIQVERFRIQSSPLTLDGLGDTLKYFSDNMTEFIAYGLSLQDFNSERVDSGEILSGLSAHTNLMVFSVTGCNLTGPFNSATWMPAGLQSLVSVNLDGNSITQMGENVFDFDVNSTSLTISLSANKLNETSFHPNSGVVRAGRRTALLLDFNQITTLPAPIFEIFLDAHPENAVELLSNPLICDERLSWIKSRRDELENRVIYAFCSNDPNYTVFTSNLIP